MNMTDFIGLAPIGALLLIAVGVLGFIANRRAHQTQRLLAAAAEMRKMMESMQADLAHLKDETKPSPSTPEPAPLTFGAAPLLTADQRASALEMLRRGADAAEVSATIGIHGAEAELLQRVQRFLDTAPSLS